MPITNLDESTLIPVNNLMGCDNMPIATLVGVSLFKKTI